MHSYLRWTFEGRASRWLYVVGLLFLIAFLHYGGMPLVFLVRLLGDSSQWPPLVAYVVNHLPLVIFLIAAPLWVQVVHKRPWWTVAFPRLALEAWNLGIGALFALLAIVVTWTFYTTVLGISITPGSPDPATYWPSFVFALAFVFMQTTSEELVHRGYAMQAVRRFTASPIAIVVLSALLFAIPHYDNVVGLGWPWWGILSYAAPAVLFAWMVLRTGSLWMPIGWHWLNNFVLGRVLVVKADLTGAGSAFLYADRYPPLEMTLLTQTVVFFLMAVAINHLVSQRARASESVG